MMPRVCVCCNLSEIRLGLDERIRQGGASFAEIAREYATYKISPDAIERHAHAHVLKDKPKNGHSDPAELLRGIIAETAELASHCKSVSDSRGALDAIASQLRAVTALIEHEHAEKEEATADSAKQQRGVTIEALDEMVRNAERNYDPCPTCGAFTRPKFPKLDSEKPSPELPN